ncbi:MAG: peptidoglycan DD-metalloendopeptidase family protein [Dongiaceae bacterium]
MGKNAIFRSRSRFRLAPLSRRSRYTISSSRRRPIFSGGPRSGVARWTRTPQAKLALMAVVLLGLLWSGRNYREARYEEESRAAGAELQRLASLYLDVSHAREELRRRADAMAARFFPRAASAPPPAAPAATLPTATLPNATLPNAVTPTVAPPAASSPPALQLAAVPAVPAGFAMTPTLLPENASADAGPAPAEEMVVEDGPVEQTVEVQKGDTLLSLLLAAGVARAQAHNAVTALRNVFPPRGLQPGQEIKISLNAGDSDSSDPDASAMELLGLKLQPSVERDVTLTRDVSGGFVAATVAKPLSVMTSRGAGVVDSSLFEAGQDGGVPLPVMNEMIKALSYDIDFQRDIQPGDSFEVIYERYQDSEGNFAKPGNILYAGMRTGGKLTEFYRYAPQGGSPDFYGPDGTTIRKALLRTPVEVAHITSGFGMRMHPLLGFSLMHKGVDFGAPVGTPIFAAGDGTIVKIGGYGSYGNYILVRHNNQFSTAYAHLSRFGKGLSTGSHVRQGQVIGFVGTTGRSTGPHLHFEVIKNGTQINPLAGNLPLGQKLEGKDLARFRTAKAIVDRMRQTLGGPVLVASDGRKPVVTH